MVALSLFAVVRICLSKADAGSKSPSILGIYKVLIRKAFYSSSSTAMERRVSLTNKGLLSIYCLAGSAVIKISAYTPDRKALRISRAEVLLPPSRQAVMRTSSCSLRLWGWAGRGGVRSE